MNLILAIVLSTFPYSHELGIGHIMLESEEYIAKYDTLIEGGDDYCDVRIRVTNAYLCAKSEPVSSEVKRAWLIEGTDSTGIEPTGLYNLDSNHRNISYIKRKKTPKGDFLFARLGPVACPYYVVWKKVGKAYKRKDIFEPAIQHDLYADDDHLIKWLSTLK